MSSQIERYGPGACVSWYERNGYDDSDFVGVFAVTGEGGAVSYEVATTGSTAWAGGFIPKGDASDEARAAYEVARTAALSEFEVTMIKAGRPVTVVEAVTRGKNKIEAGEAGTVFWTGEVKDRYGRKVGDRVGIETFEGRKVFVAAGRVRVQGFESETSATETTMFNLSYVWPPARKS